MSLNDPDLDTRIGDRIRALRAARGLTLDTLAQLADVSRAMLSRVERGQSSPTAQLLNKICAGLGISLSTLFAQTQSAPSPLSRHADQKIWQDPASHYLRRSVSPPGTVSPVEIVEIIFPAGARVGFDTRVPHSDQHIWVLQGRLDLTIGDATTRLEEGDCMMMRFDQDITFHNPTPHPIRYAVILSHGAARS